MLIIDAHIHIQECFDLEKFFDFSEYNFQKQANRLKSESFVGVLCLTESSGINVFGKLKGLSDKKEKVGDWKINTTGEDNSLSATKKSFMMFIIAGRQIVTEKKLEVLAVGLEDDFTDGKPIEKVIQHIASVGAIPVIPWGFGKWFFTRKKILEKIISDKKFPVFLGDNGNRPWILRKSKLIRVAYKNHILNLPGSDPLPFHREIQKPGSFGLYVEEIVNQDKPFDSMYKILTTNSHLKTYGKPEKLVYFLKNQISMQIIKGRRK